MIGSAKRRILRNRGKRVTHRFTALVASLAAVAGVVVAASSPAYASGLSSIVCGGAKQGGGWGTYPVGGYSGEGCGVGIDEHNTPTYGAYSQYSFGYTDGGTHQFDAWIPTNPWNNAKMDYSIWVCGTDLADIYVNQNDNGGWVTLYTLRGYAGCGVVINAWSGMNSGGFDMGLDAISSHSESGTHYPDA